jgi:hypothetical protein
VRPTCCLPPFPQILSPSLPEMADDGSASASPTGSASGSPSPPPSPFPLPSYQEVVYFAFSPPSFLPLSLLSLNPNQCFMAESWREPLKISPFGVCSIFSQNTESYQLDQPGLSKFSIFLVLSRDQLRFMIHP